MAIVAELPKSLDPDLVEAREIAVKQEGRRFYSDPLRAGEHDTSLEVVYALKGIKRGRELEREGK